jgi:hypothetical protein
MNSFPLLPKESAVILLVFQPRIISALRPDIFIRRLPWTIHAEVKLSVVSEGEASQPRKTVSTNTAAKVSQQADIGSGNLSNNDVYQIIADGHHRRLVDRGNRGNRWDSLFIS